MFSYGNSSITLKVMEQNGTLLPGEIYQDLGYVSTYIVLTCFLTYNLSDSCTCTMNQSVLHCFSFGHDRLVKIMQTSDSQLLEVTVRKTFWGPCPTSKLITDQLKTKFCTRVNIARITQAAISSSCQRQVHEEVSQA